MEKKQQKIRFNDNELLVIKNTFADNEDLLKLIRKIVLQIPLTAFEKTIWVNTFTGESKSGLIQVIRKCFLPELEGDAPLNQVIDLWMTVPIGDKLVEMAIPHLQARNIVINYMEQQMKVLAGDKEPVEIIFNDLINMSAISDKELYARVIARNTIIQHTEQQLVQLQLLAGQKSETPEQTIERLSKNSNK